MSRIAKFNKNLEYSEKFDYYSYVGFRYHRLLFKSLICRGMKLKAFNFMIKLKYYLKSKEHVDPYWIILIALMKISPDVLVYPLKLGGAVQEVPLFICARKQYTFSVKWVVKLMKDKHGLFTVRSIADTLISAIYGKGPSMEKKLSVYDNSMLNRHLTKFFKF